VRFPMIKLVLLGVMLMVDVVGCMTMETPSDSAVVIEGRVTHKEIEGGFWAIDADDGRQFTPLNLPKVFQQDNLRVTVVAKPRSDVASIHMYGVQITILEIKPRP